MVATPTFTAQLGDTLTGDPVRSGRDSRITSSRGPLWSVYNPTDAPSFRSRNIYELIADNMSMITREAELPFIRLEGGAFFGENLTDIGGTSQHIWITTRQSVLGSSDQLGRLYELSPHDFSVRQEHMLTTSGLAYGVDGDNDVLYVGFLVSALGDPGGNRGHVSQYNAETLARIRTTNLTTRWPTSIAGDSDGVWIAWRHPITLDSGIRQYTNRLAFVANHAYPLIDQGHRPLAIGGGSKRIYYTTYVDEARPDWSVGGYIHTIRPADFTVVRTYGPFVSDPLKFPWAVGGK